MMGRLDGKVAIILGASDPRSMGAATARRFVAEGADLVLAARRKDAVADVAGPLGATAVACDITDENDLAALAKMAVDTYGKLDIAINYAGIEGGAPIIETTADMFRQQADVHFVGTGLFIKQMALAMKDGGSIITASSLTVLVQAPGQGAYAGSKGGADVLVKVAANELGARGIRVNSIAPGFTKSAMTDAYFAMEAVTRAFLKEMPLGRFPTVDDIADCALWLASDEAFVTGQRIDVTAGQALRRTPRMDEFA
ncbi:SDR family oxidoreductase [Sphingobium phenoxybenzoativorans]|uniref:SDR family oxidoreductase n=1 Tax=Sphingobium phenoxybenzoativorans TaxID=1592790 RepID=A0A975K9X9_9SPHN|nr:SDR family oxidoreductase [Sphingobium phenoxybenzoativorans]QUT07490.1 SDR family oxidoreductase [Sphingobium phenoxybenzoativorans]